MKKIATQDLALTDRNFTLFFQSRMSVFTGLWTLCAVETSEAVSGNLDYLINLSGHNYFIHPGYIRVLKELITDVRSNQDVHIRIRVMDADQKTFDLEANGTFAQSKEHERGQKYRLSLNETLRFIADPVEIEESVTALAMKYFGADRCYYCTIEGDYSIIRRDARKEGLPSVAGKYPLSSFTLLKKVIDEGVPFVVPDANTSTILDEPLREICLRLQVISFLDVPVIKNGNAKGILCLVQSTPRNWTDTEMQLAVETAEWTWAAVERARAEKVLQKRESELALIQKIGGIAGIEMFIDSVDKLESWRSPEYRELHGLMPGVEFETHEDWLNRIHPDDRERTNQTFLNALAGPENSYQNEYRVIRPIDGQTRWIFAKIDIERNDDGKPIRLMGAHIDITERKIAEGLIHDAEDRLRSQLELEIVNRTKEVLHMQEMLALQATNKYELLFNAIDQGFCIIKVIFDSKDNAMDYQFLEVNPAFEKQTGLKHAEGKTMLELVPQHDQHWFEIYGNVVRQQKPVRFVQQAVAMDRWYDVYAFPTGQPEQHHVAILFLDITKRKLTEIELKKLNSELTKIDEAKTIFFSNISHEFRTPLTLMLSPLQDLIRNSSIPKLQHEKLDIIQRNAHRLQKLVNTLLDFSRIEAGQKDAVFQPVDIVKYTTDLAGNFRSLVEDAGLKLVVKAEDPKEPVYLNPSMYEKIMLNLLSNAFKFTLKGSIRIDIKVKKKKVELVVSDTGIGIHPAHHKKIFERFNRLENRNARTFEGTGIGLALVKELVEIHGGTINVKSIPDTGTRFTIAFPRGKDHIPKDKIYASKIIQHYNMLPDYLEEMKGWMHDDESIEQKAKPFTMKPLVVIADDNADMRMYLGSVLQEKFQVLKVSNGRKVLEKLNSGLIPDAVITDVMMPDMDGFELLARIKNNEAFRKIPVIMLSARMDEETRIEGMRYGADDYLVKPFSSRELVSRVDARIQIARLQLQLHEKLASLNADLGQQVKQRTEAMQLLNTDLKEKNYKLETVNEELSHLTFAAGNDLQKPLQRLGIYIKLLLHEKEISAAFRTTLEKMDMQASALSGMLDALSSYSNVSAGVGKKSETDMHQLWLFVRESLSELIIKTKAHIQEDIGGKLLCDPIQVNLLLTQIVQSSILSSGEEARPELILAGRTVSGNDIRHPRAVREKAYYELSLRYKATGTDDGSEKIFQLFERFHTHIDYPGTGLGLAVSRRIVENHGGFMVIRNWKHAKFGFCCYFPQS